eukprot:723610-Karenia_brevis.AAC.1
MLKLALFLQIVFDGFSLPEWLSILQRSFYDWEIPSNVTLFPTGWNRIIRLWTALAITLSLGGNAY